MIRPLLLTLAILVAASVADAQEAPVQPPQQTQAQTAEERLRNLPPQIRLGLRVEATRQRLPVASAVVIVSNQWAYLEAVQMWSLAVRFPVLIDDGSDIARENIGRFVRAFKPGVVLHWDGDGQGPLNRELLRAGIEQAVANAWHAPSYAELGAKWKELGLVPPGIVALNSGDAAWTAAAALAAGRGQPIAWFEIEGGHPGRAMSAEELSVIRSAIVTEFRNWDFAWGAIGDDIDAVALCTNTASRVQSTDRPLALTDLVGRHGDEKQWAWCGQIVGRPAEAAYAAMCSLYLRPSSAWVFNGYPLKPNFNLHQPVQAAELFEQIGMAATIDANPNEGLTTWRMRTSRPINAELAIVSTSGMRKWFDLTPGRAYYSDVPALRLPTVVHFTHSFSAQLLNDRDSIARRWIDQGAYAYVGAVDEPYLAAFQPTDTLLSRLFAGAPLAAAARLDNAQPWKVTVLGDPLTTVLRPDAGRPPIEGSPAIEGAERVELRLRRQLENERLAEGCRSLIMLGRDADVARLIRTMLGDRPELFTPELAREAFFALFRTSQRDLMLEAFDRLDRETRAETMIVDAMWQAFRNDLRTTTDDRLVDAMRSCVREVSIVEDGSQLLAPVKRVYNYDVAVAMTGELIQRTGDDSAKAELRAALGRLSRD